MADYPDFITSTGYGTGAGLKGWNCRHDFYPVILGISEPAYTEEELANIDPPPIEYNGKTLTYYECTQKQRAMETAMRKTKREIIAAEASGDEDMFTAKSILLRRQKEEYAEFSKAAKFYTQNERTQVYGFGKSVAQKARWKAEKTLDKYAQYHYNKNGNIIVTDDWKEKNKPTIPQKYKPYAVIETKTTDKNGNVQIDRSYYDENGTLKKQVHSGNHGKPKMHPYGQYGEHKHKYTWIDDQKHPDRTTEELDTFDKKENSDII